MKEKTNIQPVDINHEMNSAYLQYSMSVIVGRALPDVRDGLKPVHRRVLFAMNDLSNFHDKPYKKSARVVGDVIGKYHPHGDTSAYETIVRMAQDFSLRYPLVDGQGNFGSIDGDAAAAQRYTEVRMTLLAEEILKDIDKETVSFQDNYDNSLKIPSVLPCKFPNLLANGSSGIAVGMATNIPPHNLGELIKACIQMIRKPQVTIDEILKIVRGPDFPTAGMVIGRGGLVSAYKKGRGVITLRSVAEIVTNKKNRDSIVITELPFQVNKARLLEHMAELVKTKKIEGISDLRDESSREGLRVVIDIKKGEDANIILNQLYKFTQLQTSFGIILLALDTKNQPKIYNLKSMLEAFIDHRKDVITHRCIFELKKASAKAHIFEGLKRALHSIDEVVKLIRASKEASMAKTYLINKFSFSEMQAQAILEMRLQRLTGLERQKIESELVSLRKTMAELKNILSSSEKVYEIIIKELEWIDKKFFSERKTKIILDELEEQSDEELISKEDMVVTLTRSGMVKRISIDEYRLQKRGGKGLKGIVREEDSMAKVFSANTHTSLLFLSDRGRLHWSKVFKLPQGTRTTKGKSIRNFCQLSEGENIREILPVENFSDQKFIAYVSKKGYIKKTNLSSFEKPRQSGVVALTIDEEDELVSANITDGKSKIIIFTKKGLCIMFGEDKVRPMGRAARGVRGINLSQYDEVVSVEIFSKDRQTEKDYILLVTESGYGKRISFEDFRPQGRGGKGIIAQKVTSKTGLVISSSQVRDEDQVLLITNQGQTIRMRVSDISIIGRNTQGVRLMGLKEGEVITEMTLINEDR